MKLRTRLVLLMLACIMQSSPGCRWASNSGGIRAKALPPDIAGTWQARKSPWKIVLSRNGTVSSMRVPMCVKDLKPNRTTKVEMKHGEFSTFKGGDCDVEYTPDTRELFVEIKVDEMNILFPSDSLKGHSVDRFVGPVSEDGKVWTTDWINVFDYGPRFPQGPDGIVAEPLVFDKITD